MKILLLEDNFDVGESMVRALELRGWEIVWREDVASAVQVYGTRGSSYFDVIISDWELPDGTGADFLGQIQGSDRAYTIVFSGLDRTRELDAAGLTVDAQFSKGDPISLLDKLKEIAAQ